MGRGAQRAAIVVFAGIAACSVVTGPAPRALRDHDFPLVRVDGKAVRGTSTAPAPPGSASAKYDCVDRVAEGALHITDNGEVFTYRSTMRNCAGRLLVSETNEGRITRRDSTLTFMVYSATGPLSFRGHWTDSTIVIYDWGGRLEFRRPR